MEVDEPENVSELVQELNRSAKSVSPSSDHEIRESSPKDDVRQVRFVPTMKKDANMNQSARSTSELSNGADNNIVKYCHEFDLPSRFPTHTMVGNLQLPFPHFNIGPTFYGNKRYSASNTCSLDSSLFLLYYIYKSNSEEFRSLIDPNIPVCGQLLQTFNLVENEGWDIARVYWISIHATGPYRNKSNQHHDLFTTADNNVFQYVRELQKYVVKSTCTSTDCPKLLWEKRSVDIAMP
jgi:hypothetical protein